MLLSPDIRSKLLQLIRTRFDADSFDELLQTSIKDKLYDFVGNEGWNAQSLKVLAALERAPAALRTVLGAIRVERSDTADVVAQVLMNLDDIAPDDDHLMRIVRFSGQYFADRATFRRAALELPNENGPRVLVLAGGAGTGKSHCWFFVEKLRLSKGVRPVNVDLDEWGPAEVTASELASALLSGCGIDAYALVEDPTVQQPRAAKQIMDLVVQRLVHATGTPMGPVWVFIDHAYRAQLRKDAREFIVLLARKAVMNAVPGLRLIVVDPAGELGMPSTMPLEVTPIHAGDLIELLQHQLESLALESSVLATAARDVLSRSAVGIQVGLDRAIKRLREDKDKEQVS